MVLIISDHVSDLNHIVNTVRGIGLMGFDYNCATMSDHTFCLLVTGTDTIQLPELNLLHLSFPVHFGKEHSLL